VALAGETDTLIAAGAEMETDVVFVTPLALAVICTDVAVVAEFTWSVNCPLEDPVGIVIFDGIVTVAPETEFPSETAKLVVAEAVNDTVHCDDPGALSVVGVQLTLDNATGRTTVRVPGEPEVGTASPAPDAATESVSWTDVELAEVVAAIVKVAVAMVPEAMGEAFMPDVIQVYRSELVALHWTFLPAAEAAAPVLTVTALMSPGEYAKVQLTLLVWVLLDANETGTDTVEPGWPEPDPSERPTDWAKLAFPHTRIADMQRAGAAQRNDSGGFVEIIIVEGWC
jgi:hypothetical protein